ncbi:THAP domain-containing protein 11-like isoform X1 [Haemaphysalis longicornis]
MPKNCCMPLCKSNALRNPELYYHELPSNEDLRKAWLRNISRQGSDKNSQWQPSSRAVVLNSGPVESRFSCLRQFNGGNNRVDTRTSVFTAEKLLKVGTLGAARSTNAKQL